MKAGGILLVATKIVVMVYLGAEIVLNTRTVDLSIPSKFVCILSHTGEVSHHLIKLILLSVLSFDHDGLFFNNVGNLLF